MAIFLQPSTDKSKSTTSTSGGLMFTSPLNRNKSTIEIGESVSGQSPDETKQVEGTKKTLSQQNSIDTVSVGSSSVDWSPPDTAMHSRRNTVLSGQSGLIKKRFYQFNLNDYLFLFFRRSQSYYNC